jgi:hypothetical protein
MCAEINSAHNACMIRLREIHSGTVSFHSPIYFGLGVYGQWPCVHSLHGFRASGRAGRPNPSTGHAVASYNMARRAFNFFGSFVQCSLQEPSQWIHCRCLQCALRYSRQRRVLVIIWQFAIQHSQINILNRCRLTIHSNNVNAWTDSAYCSLAQSKSPPKHMCAIPKHACAILYRGCE